MIAFRKEHILTPQPLRKEKLRIYQDTAREVLRVRWKAFFVVVTQV